MKKIIISILTIILVTSCFNDKTTETTSSPHVNKQIPKKSGVIKENINKGEIIVQAPEIQGTGTIIITNIDNSNQDDINNFSTDHFIPKDSKTNSGLISEEVNEELLNNPAKDEGNFKEPNFGITIVKKIDDDSEKSGKGTFR